MLCTYLAGAFQYHAGWTLRVEQAIALLASVKTLLFLVQQVSNGEISGSGVERLAPPRLSITKNVQLINMSQPDPQFWDLIRMLTGGLAGLILILLYFIAFIQLYRAKFFLLEMTDAFLFYYTFASCCVTTLTFFFKVFAIWNLEHSIDLLLQIVFFLIFALVIDPKKRIYLLWKAFKIAAILSALIYISITLIEYLAAIQTLSRGWPCSGFLGLIIPMLTLIVSIALTITATIVTCRTKQVSPPDEFAHLLDQSSQADSQSPSSKMTFQKYIKMKSMRIKRAQHEERKIKQAYSFRYQDPSSHPHSPTFDRKNTIKKYNRFLTLTKTTNIEKLVADYCYASQKELRMKRKEVLMLIFINLASILLSVGIGFYLVAKASPSFQPVHVKKECSQNFDFPLWKTVLVNLLRMLGEYSIIIVVFYYIFWKHRQAARGDSLESSFDFIIEQDEGEGGDPHQEGFMLLNQSKKDAEEEEEENSEGENFADWIHRKDSEGDRKSNLKLKKKKQSETANPFRHRNSSAHQHFSEPRNSLHETAGDGANGLERLKREESILNSRWS